MRTAMSATMGTTMSRGRRGQCPSLAAPLKTGDGLLVRLTPSGETITLDAFAGLCAAARAHGNGTVEITRRGSIQVRGLGPAASSALAVAAAALPLARAAGVPVAVPPLAGLDLREIAAARDLADALARALAVRPARVGPSPKVTVAVDGGGALTLAHLDADIRLTAVSASGEAGWYLAVGGDAANATPLGGLAAPAALEAVPLLCRAIAARGPAARARDIVAREGIAPLQRSVSHLLTPLQPPPPAVAAEPLAAHPLRDGRVALGVALPFGHARAEDLARLAETARSAGALGVRTAPEHVLLIIGLAGAHTAHVRERAARLSLIVDAGDPRRRVAACAGAPACASALMATRTLADAVAQLAAPLAREGVAVHLSGCAKGCAHPRASPLTLVGTAEGCGIIIGGSARSSPLATAPGGGEAPLALLAHLMGALARARRPGEPIAAIAGRLGPERLAALIAERAP
jgi:precorrin-3B synthase